MALTRDFKQTDLARAQADVKFRDALRKEAIEAMLARDERLQNLNVAAFQSFSDHVGAKAHALGMTAEEFTALLSDKA